MQEALEGSKGLAQTLRLGPVEAQQYADRIRSGVLLQLRSMPVGMRIDAWLHTDYPALADLHQMEASELTDFSSESRGH